MYFFIFFIVILLLLFIPKRSDSKIKGIEGEKLVIKKINKLSGKHIILNDLLINYKNNTTQIDHVVILKTGIFIIETKNFSGKLYGDVNEKYWIQLLNGYENTFYNPVWQNNTHVRAIKDKLGKNNKIPIHSVVVFCGKCKLKRIKGVEEVVDLKRLNKYIKSIKSDKKLSNDEMEEVRNILEKSNIKSIIKRKQHVKNIRKNIDSNDKY